MEIYASQTISAWNGDISITAPVTLFSTGGPIDLLVTGAHDTTINGVISDVAGPGTSGSIAKTGTGTLTLTAANSYSGGTIASVGLINFNSASNFGSGNITFYGGGLQWAAGNTTDISSRLDGSGGGDAVFDTNGNDVAFATGFSGAGGVTKQGAGMLTLNAANTYVGGTTISAGTLALSGNGALTATGAVSLVNPGATFDISQASGDRTIGLLTGGAGTTILLGTNTLTFGYAPDGVVASAISGQGGLVKQGSGKQTLTGANTFTGGTTIDSGILALSGGGALAPDGAVTFAAAGVGFDISAASGNRAIGSVGGVAGSDITLGANSLTLGGAADAVFDGEIGGAGGIVKQGTGTQALGGGNAYAGTTTISTGVLNIRNGSALGTTAAGTSVASGAALEIQGDITVGAEALTLNGAGVSNGGALRNVSGANAYDGSVSLGSAARINSDASTLTLSNASAVSSTNLGLTVGGAGNTTISGVVALGSGGLTKDGSGVLALSGVNTYTGVTTVSAGTLALSGAGSIAASSGVVVEGAFDISGTTSGASVTNLSGTSAAGVVALGTKTLTVVAQTGFLDYAGSLTGTGTLIKQGVEAFTLSGNSSAFAGTTEVAAGILFVSNHGGTSAGILGGNVTVASGATLEGVGGTITGAVSVAAGGTLGWTTQGS
ncbi:autotransporter-associated beta strand repeat-containing protein, partial [Aquabacter sp. CN5-332]|uniref:beta strand repeat-containing protein n=1 Tax=Aquabacter sp. CN5-332 TaxID=3156608 RepID=UPI0032B3132E